MWTATQRLVELVQAAPGNRWIEVGRSPDETDLVVVVSSWDDAGSARRGLTATPVRMECWPLFACAIDEPTSYEAVVRATPEAAEWGLSDLAADSIDVRLGEASGPDIPRSTW